MDNMTGKNFMKLSMEEKDFLDRIVSISCIDKKIVKEVLQSILKMTTIELYAESDIVYIPYLCSLSISSHEKITDKGIKTIVELEALPSENLIEEVKAINEGEITPTQNFTRQRMFEKIEEKIEL